MRSYLLSHAGTVLGVLASFLMLVRLRGAHRTSQSTLAWMLGFVFVPFAAIPLFLLLGSRKFPARAKGPAEKSERWTEDEMTKAPKVSRVLGDSGVSPPRVGNSFELVGDGENAFARLVELVRGARSSIDLTMFILGHDETGRAIVDALAERAVNGVRVRVILDAVGCARSRFYAREKLEPRGAEVRLFMPLGHSPIRGRTNLRSHRKLAVIDRETVFGGGMNLANEYMGAGAWKNGTRWRDVVAVVRGPVAFDAEAMFESDWAFVGGKPRGEARTASENRGDEIVQIVPSGPDFASDTVYDLFLTVLGEAKTRVVIVTPYYVPDDALQHALVLAARRGVKTELVVPSVSNHGLADVARRDLLRELARSGVVIHYYPHGMVHAKAMVTDDSFAYVGSPNFDMRSLYLNYEDAICVYSPGAIASVRAFAEGLISESTTAGPKLTEHATLEQLARFLAPEL